MMFGEHFLTDRYLFHDIFTVEIQIKRKCAKIIVKVTSTAVVTLGTQWLHKTSARLGCAKGYLAMIGIYTVHIHAICGAVAH